VKAKVSAKKLEALQAASEGRLFRAGAGGPWFIDYGKNATAHAIGKTGNALAQADWVRLRPPVDGVEYARLTARGRQALADATTGTP
jgi:hypothetical protein